MGTNNNTTTRIARLSVEFPAWNEEKVADLVNTRRPLECVLADLPVAAFGGDLPHGAKA
jgi:hypothetical protein